MTKTINEFYKNCRTEILEKIDENPLNKKNLKKGQKIKLWSGLEEKSKYSLSENKTQKLKDYLALISYEVSHYFSAIKYDAEIKELRGDKIIFGVNQNYEINYKFVELIEK